MTGPAHHSGVAYRAMRPACAALALLLALPATAQITVTASSPDGRWKATKAGKCIAVLSFGDQIHMENLRDRVLTWDGGCDAAGLADGEGTLTLTYRFVENGTSSPGKTEQRITFRNGLLDGAGTRIFYDRPSHPPNAPWQAQKPEKAIYSNGCEYWILGDGSRKQTHFCEEAKGVAFRDTLRAGTAARPPVPSAAATPATPPPPDLAALRARAERGDAVAQFDLGVRYWTGNGVPREQGESVRWYRRAADQGHSTAQAYLAIRYMFGDVLPKDDAEAARLARLSAQQGDAAGQKALGYLYRVGRGVPQDPVEAARLMKLGAEGGDLEAQEMYATFLLMGRGVGKNLPEAARWFRIAADRGNREAQLLLGLMTYYGNGVPRDRQQGVALIQAAQNQGHPDAAARLAKIAQEQQEAAAAQQRLEQQRRQQQLAQQQAEQARARQQAAERQASGRLAAGAVTALLGGNARQVQQALSGQQVTAPPPRPQPAPAQTMARAQPSSSASQAGGRVDHCIERTTSPNHFSYVNGRKETTDWVRNRCSFVIHVVKVDPLSNRTYVVEGLSSGMLARERVRTSNTLMACTNRWSGRESALECR